MTMRKEGGNKGEKNKINKTFKEIGKNKDTHRNKREQESRLAKMSKCTLLCRVFSLSPLKMEKQNFFFLRDGGKNDQFK